MNPSLVIALVCLYPIGCGVTAVALLIERDLIDCDDHLFVAALVLWPIVAPIMLLRMLVHGAVITYRNAVPLMKELATWFIKPF